MESHLWLDNKYAGLISSRLRNFKRKNPNLYNFSCPICNDSHKNIHRARGYLFSKNQSLLFTCHNCGVYKSFSNFLKDLAPDLYTDYLKDIYLEKYTSIKEETTELPELKIINEVPQLNQLPSIMDLRVGHSARIYCEARKIPLRYLFKIKFTSNFNDWVNTILPEKLPTFSGVPRIVIPFLNEKSGIIGFTGRSIFLYPFTQLRYITIMLDHEAPKVFGLDTVDKNKTVYITEGPIDSLMIDNAIAMAGSDFQDIFQPENCVVIYDNEKRNKEIIKRLEKTIKKGYGVFIWPKYINKKDLNELICSGMSRNELKKLIVSRTFKGIMANLELNNWKS